VMNLMKSYSFAFLAEFGSYEKLKTRATYKFVYG